MKTYILQKDLPDIKAGARGMINENGLLCFYETTETPEYFFPKNVYENNLEWFKLEEDKIKVQVLWIGREDLHTYRFKTSNLINIEYKHKSICKAIEFVLNNEDKSTFYKDLLDATTYQRKYSEEDMRKCFDAARMPVNNYDMKPVFMKYEDYINSLKNEQ